MDRRGFVKRIRYKFFLTSYDYEGYGNPPGKLFHAIFHIYVVGMRFMMMFMENMDLKELFWKLAKRGIGALMRRRFTRLYKC